MEEEGSKMEDVCIEEEEILDPDTSQSDSTAAREAGGSAKKCCGCLEFHGSKEARGYAILGVGRGAVVMSNIFLASSFIYLAYEEAGCLDEENVVIEGCENTVHGFKPPSLVSNVAVFSGLLSAFLMPLTGAIIDFTPHRRLVGILAAALLIAIQTAQIFTISSTWYPMLILQAIAGFIYQVAVLASFAYLPEIAQSVGQKLMNRFTSTFTMMQFTAQALYLIVVAVPASAFVFDFNDVQTAQLSQGINVVWISIAFFIGWKMLPDVPSRHKIHKNRSIWTEGFKQIWHTSISINRNYAHGLRWFLVATIFADAGANAFTVIAVIFLNDHLGMNSTEIAIVFLITLVACVPGAKIGCIVIKRTDPNTSWKIAMVIFSIATLSGAFALASPDQKYLAYVWGTMWGFILGWFYSTETLFFSMVLPKGQEAELTGFFVYCTQILTFLPPLVFTLIIESGANMKWGLMSMIGFFIIPVGVLCLMSPWEEVLKESAKTIAVVNVQDDTGETSNAEEP